MMVNIDFSTSPSLYSRSDSCAAGEVVLPVPPVPSALGLFWK